METISSFASGVVAAAAAAVVAAAAAAVAVVVVAAAAVVVVVVVLVAVAVSPLTRAEQEALDRKIPWRAIIRENSETIVLYRKAAAKERNNWRDWSSVRPVGPHKADEI